MSGSTEAIDYFGGSGSPLVRLKARVSLRARRQMYAVLEEQFRPGPQDTVLDVGVTPDRTLADSNAFEQFYPFTSQITAQVSSNRGMTSPDRPRRAHPTPGQLAP